MFEKYDAYKDSGVEWIGDIPAQWSLKKISHVFRNIGSGTTPLSGSDIYYKNGSINWLQTGDLNDSYINETSKKITEKALRHYSTLKQYPKGSLVVAMYGATIGKVGILNIDTATNQACCVLEASFGVDIKYYFYMLQGFKADIIRMAYGGGQPNISQDTIKKLRLPFPDLSAQYEISKFLDQKTSEIDQAIAIKERQIALLNERKQIVIQKAVTQGLDPNVTMKDSGVEWIGQIPEHWNTITKLKHIASLKGRQGWQGLKADEYIDEGPYVVSSAHFDGLDINWDKCPHVSIERYKMDAHIQLNIGDILLMKDGAKMGKMAYISNLPDLACLNSHLLLIRSLKTQDEFFFDSKYMLYFMLSEKFQDYVQVKGTGTTFMGISQESIGNFPIALPSLEEQVQITSFLDKRMLELEKGKDLLLTQIEKLKEYKTTLINDAVTGKIKVA